MAKRVKKTPRKVLENKLDKLWAKAVKIKAGFKCEKCGATDKQLHSHHIMSRRHKATRWNLGNGLCLCAYCHNWGGAHSSHFITQEEFHNWLRIYYRRTREPIYGTLEELGQLAHSTIKWPLDELKGMIKTLERVVK